MLLISYCYTQHEKNDTCCCWVLVCWCVVVCCLLLWVWVIIYITRLLVTLWHSSQSSFAKKPTEKERLLLNSPSVTVVTLYRTPRSSTAVLYACPAWQTLKRTPARLGFSNPGWVCAKVACPGALPRPRCEACAAPCHTYTSLHRRRRLHTRRRRRHTPRHRPRTHSRPQSGNGDGPAAGCRACCRMPSRGAFQPASARLYAA